MNRCKLVTILFFVVLQLNAIMSFAAVDGGTNALNAPLIKLPATDINILYYDSRVWKFVPLESATYTISSVSSNDPYARLFDGTDFSDGNIIATGDDESGFNFVINYYVTAGTTYYIMIYDYESDNTCSLNIIGGALLSSYVGFSNGSAFTPSITVGNTNQVIGRFILTADEDGAYLNDASIKLNGTRTGVSNFKLWASGDATFNSGSDTQLGSTVAIDPGNGGSVSFSGLNNAIGTLGTWYFLTCDVTSEATGSIQGVLVSNSNLTLANGLLYETINNDPLSNSDVSLPVEISLFTANVQSNAVVLTWQTASETGNLGFILERASGNGAWQQIASYKTEPALKGQGNSSSTTNYSYIDNTVNAGIDYRYRLGDVNIVGSVTMHSPISANTNALPQSTEMFNAYPNPFNPETKISYQLHKNTRVTITVYDLLGRQVKTLVDDQQAAGSYHIIWNGTDATGAKAASGAYLIRMQTIEVSQTQKVLLLK